MKVCSILRGRGRQGGLNRILPALLGAGLLAVATALPAAASSTGQTPYTPIPGRQVADNAACTYNCQSSYSNCTSRCSSYSCRSSCSGRYRACLTRCTSR